MKVNKHERVNLSWNEWGSATDLHTLIVEGVTEANRDDAEEIVDNYIQECIYQAKEFSAFDCSGNVHTSSMETIKEFITDESYVRVIIEVTQADI